MALIFQLSLSDLWCNWSSINWTYDEQYFLTLHYGGRYNFEIFNYSIIGSSQCPPNHNNEWQHKEASYASVPLSLSEDPSWRRIHSILSRPTLLLPVLRVVPCLHDWRHGRAVVVVTPVRVWLCSLRVYFPSVDEAPLLLKQRSPSSGVRAPWGSPSAITDTALAPPSFLEPPFSWACVVPALCSFCRVHRFLFTAKASIHLRGLPMAMHRSGPHLGPHEQKLKKKPPKCRGDWLVRFPWSGPLPFFEDSLEEFAPLWRNSHQCEESTIWAAEVGQVL